MSAKRFNFFLQGIVDLPDFRDGLVPLSELQRIAQETLDKPETRRKRAARASLKSLPSNARRK